MKQRFKNVIAVFLILERINEFGKKEILLMKRKNVSYGDGMYDCPAGHLEPNENLIQAIIRESKEEIGIDIKEENLELVQVFHLYKDEYMYMYFKTDKYTGTPEIKEPNKCDELKWFEIDNLPEKLLTRTRNAINNINQGIMFGYDDEFTN